MGHLGGPGGVLDRRLRSRKVAVAIAARVRRSHGQFRHSWLNDASESIVVCLDRARRRLRAIATIRIKKMPCKNKSKMLMKLWECFFSLENQFETI